MRKFILLIICLSLSVLLVPISGCSDKEDTHTTLKFVAWKPNQPEVWDEVYSIFEQEHPEIRIEREIGPSSSTALHDLLTQKLKNRSTDVDVFLMDVVWPSEFAAAGWALPLDDFFSPDSQEQFLGSTIRANTYQGHIYGIPLFIDSGILFYRKDLLEKYGFNPPETWPEMVSQAERIVVEEAGQDNEIYGFSGQFKQYEGLVCNMMEFILSNGGTFVDDDTGRSAIAGEQAIEAVRFVRDRLIDKIAPKGVLTYQESESLDLFTQGKAVFHRNWPYAWEIADNPTKSTVSGTVGIARLPYFEGNQSYAALGGWQVGISSFSEKKDTAWIFAEFLTSERVQKLFAVKSGKAPAREVLYDDEEVLKANPHFKSMKDVFLTAYPRPVMPLYPSLSNILQRYFSTAISSPDTNIAKEADEASQEMDRILSMIR